MPNVNRIVSPYIVNGNPDTMNVALTSSPTAPGSFAPYAPGDLGASFDSNDKTYSIVQLDSGAVAATPTGVVLANQLAFWKSKTARIVTNDRRMALDASVAQGSCNEVAGVFRSALAPGTYGSLICILNRGHGVTVVAGTVSGAGQLLTADTDANGPQVVGVAVGTAPGYATLGVSRAAAASSAVTCDIDIPTLP